MKINLAEVLAWILLWLGFAVVLKYGAEWITGREIDLLDADLGDLVYARGG